MDEILRIPRGNNKPEGGRLRRAWHLQLFSFCLIPDCANFAHSR